MPIGMIYTIGLTKYEKRELNTYLISPSLALINLSLYINLNGEKVGAATIQRICDNEWIG